MRLKLLKETDKPSFCWDRNWSIAEIRQKLTQADEKERMSLFAWIMREGTFTEIWTLLFPSEVYAHLNVLLLFLGRRKEYWRYTFDVWHKLGKV